MSQTPYRTLGLNKSLYKYNFRHIYTKKHIVHANRYSRYSVNVSINNALKKVQITKLLQFKSWKNVTLKIRNLEEPLLGKYSFLSVLISEPVSGNWGGNVRRPLTLSGMINVDASPHGSPLVWRTGLMWLVTALVASDGDSLTLWWGVWFGWRFDYMCNTEGKTTQQRNENRTATLGERQTGTWELEKPQREMPGSSARQWTSEEG